MNDITEPFRRERQAELNQAESERQALEAQYGRVWTTAELSQEFLVKSFAAPFVVAERRKDGKLGSLEFQHYPRFYFNWKED